MRETTTVRPLAGVARDSSDRSTNRLSATGALASTVVELLLEDGSAFGATFGTDRVELRAAPSPSAPPSGTGPYDAVEIRPGVYHVDVDLAELGRACTLVLDRPRRRALVVDSAVVAAAGSWTLRQRIRPARLSGSTAGGYAAVAETRELIGRRLICEYAPGTAMEHVYLNSSTIAWQRLKCPPELADEVEWERASMWKVGDELYLLGSVGRYPMEIVLLLDLEQERNVGHLFGRSSSGAHLYQLCGARIVPLGRIDYPAGYEPV